jgi:hypothetical protein
MRCRRLIDGRTEDHVEVCQPQGSMGRLTTVDALDALHNLDENEALEKMPC